MATDCTDLTVTTDDRQVNELDKALIYKASNALLRHLQKTKRDNEADQQSRNLLESDDSSSDEVIWLIVSTKKHIVQQKRLKPAKILLPHSLNISPILSICLIVPDPQRAFKDVLTRPSCPAQLRNRISRVIDVKKLEKKYKSFESKRQLKGSCDLFLADDRIITYLPKIMGKVFYESTSKRPVPVSLSKSNSKRGKVETETQLRKHHADSTSMLGPLELAREIEHTLETTTVNLSPSTSTAVRVGLASFNPDQLVENLETVVGAMVEKFVSKGWAGIKGMHIKGPSSMALPIWLAEEIWENEAEILENPVPKQLQKKSALHPARQELKQGPSMPKVEQSKDVGGKAAGVERSKRKRTASGDSGRKTKERKEKLTQKKKEMRNNLEVEGA